MWKGRKIMKMYKNLITGYFWTEDEIREAFEQYQNETELTFEQTMLDFEECTEAEERAAHIVKDGMYQAAVDLMDDDIREDLHYEMAPCSDEAFLVAYMERHYKKYGTEFAI